MNTSRADNAKKTAETNRKLRNTWGQVKPYTVPFADKRKKPIKHKGKRFEDN